MIWTRHSRPLRLQAVPRHAGLFLLLCSAFLSFAAVGQDAPERPRLLVLELTGEAVPKTERRTLTTLIGVEVAGMVDYDVVTTQELEKLLTVEKDRQLLGCLDASCLAEVADAMGTERIIFGEAGKIGTTYLLTLSLFDSIAARATERVVIKAQAIDGFVTQLPDALRDLTASLRDARDGNGAEVGSASTRTDGSAESDGREATNGRAGADEATGTSSAEGSTGAASATPSPAPTNADAGVDFLAISGWSMVGFGGLVAGVGMLYDVFSPTSSDYILDAYDVVGPGIVFTGAFIAAGGAALALVPPLLEEGSDAQ